MKDRGARTPHRLLRTLDDIVRSDSAPSQLSGSVVVAVKSPDGASYWHAAFRDDALLGCGYLGGLPADADAVMLFEDEQATDVVDGEVPAGDIKTFGSRELLDRFIRRYCEFKSMVDIRAGH